MEGRDPENGARSGIRLNGVGSGTHREVRSNQKDAHEAVGSDSASYLEGKQISFKCARNKDKNSNSLDQLQRALGSLSSDDKRKLCQETDERGNTALHYAVKAGNLEVCEYLHKNGADINAKGQNKMRPLQFAARYGDEGRPKDVWECMQWIINQLEENQKLDGKREGPVLRKRSRGSAKSHEKEELIDVREKDKYDFSLLHHAIQNTNWEETPVVAEELLKLGEFKVTDVDKQGNTSLHLAAEFDKQERHKILDVFLDNKTIPPEDLQECIAKKNKQGKTPLHIACGVGNPDSVEQLLEATNDISSIINQPDQDSQHPIHLAIESGNLKMVKILVEKGAQVSEKAINCAVRCACLIRCNSM